MQSCPGWKSFALFVWVSISAIPNIITSQDEHSHHLAIDIRGATTANLPALKLPLSRSSIQFMSFRFSH